MVKRILVGNLLVALLALVMYFDGFIRCFLFTLVSVLSIYEMGCVFKAKGAKPFLWGAYAFAASYYFLYLYIGSYALIVSLLVCVLSTFTERVFNRERTTYDAVCSLMVFIYPMLLYVILMYTVAMEDTAMSRSAMLMAFAGPLMGDTLAFFIGSFMGKHKLCPELSPKKTVEGSIGGILGGVLGGLIVYWLQPLWSGTVQILPLLIMGLICGALGQIGDLFASAMKRWADVKDYGNIFPGHGGVMDRLDSVLMCAPVVYVYFVGVLGV